MVARQTRHGDKICRIRLFFGGRRARRAMPPSDGFSLGMAFLALRRTRAIGNLTYLSLNREVPWISLSF